MNTVTSALREMRGIDLTTAECTPADVDHMAREAGLTHIKYLEIMQTGVVRSHNVLLTEIWREAPGPQSFRRKNP